MDSPGDGSAMTEKSEAPVLILYSDLDGTLLDENTYSFDAARPALERIRSRPVVLVLCTSKTRAEVEVVQQRLEIYHPFIIENGGAIYLPAGDARQPWWDGIPVADWLKVSLGVPHRSLIRRLRDIQRTTGLKLTGFQDMSPRAVASACGLSVAEARRAKRREFDEPFSVTPDTPGARRAVEEEARRLGLTVSSGGRFLHLSGGSDKGRAVAVLDHLLRRRFGPILTAGLGDSPNDLPMLRAVGRAVIVRRPDGGCHPELVRELPAARQAPGIGPDGWNQAVLGLLEEWASAGWSDKPVWESQDAR